MTEITTYLEPIGSREPMSQAKKPLFRNEDSQYLPTILSNPDNTDVPGTVANRCKEITTTAKKAATNESIDYYKTVISSNGQLVTDPNYIFNQFILPPLRHEADKTLSSLGIAPDQLRERAKSIIGIKHKDSSGIEQPNNNGAEQANLYQRNRPPKAGFSVDGLGIGYGTQGKTIGFNGTKVYFKGTNNTPKSSNNFYIEYDFDTKGAWGTLNFGF